MGFCACLRGVGVDGLTDFMTRVVFGLVEISVS